MGDAGGETIINFLALGAFTVDAEKMATLLSDPKLKEKAVAATALVNPKAAPQQPEARPAQKATVICKDPHMIAQVASYIAGEMNRKITHPSALKMKKLFSFHTAAENAKFQKRLWYASLSRLFPGNEAW